MLEIRLRELMQKLRELVRQWKNAGNDRREKNRSLGEAGRLKELMQKLWELMQKPREFVRQWKNAGENCRETTRSMGEAGEYLQPGSLKGIAGAGIILLLLNLFLHAKPAASAKYRTSGFPILCAFYVFIFGIFLLFILVDWYKTQNEYRKYMTEIKKQGVASILEDDFRRGEFLGQWMVQGEKYLFVRHAIFAIPYGDILAVRYYRTTGKNVNRGMEVVFMWNDEKKQARIPEDTEPFKERQNKWNALIEKIRAYNPNAEYNLDKLLDN